MVNDNNYLKNFDFSAHYFGKVILLNKITICLFENK